jgi:hypothetical protein
MRARGRWHTLALSAGKGVRQPVEIFRANAYLQRQVFSQLAAFAFAAAFLDPHRLGDVRQTGKRGSSEESGS